LGTKKSQFNVTQYKDSQFSQPHFSFSNLSNNYETAEYCHYNIVSTGLTRRFHKSQPQILLIMSIYLGGPLVHGHPAVTVLYDADVHVVQRLAHRFLQLLQPDFYATLQSHLQTETYRNVNDIICDMIDLMWGINNCTISSIDLFVVSVYRSDPGLPVELGLGYHTLSCKVSPSTLVTAMASMVTIPCPVAVRSPPPHW
jgi:hypothetical protein